MKSKIHTNTNNCLVRNLESYQCELKKDHEGPHQITMYDGDKEGIMSWTDMKEKKK